MSDICDAQKTLSIREDSNLKVINMQRIMGNSMCLMAVEIQVEVEFLAHLS